MVVLGTVAAGLAAGGSAGLAQPVGQAAKRKSRDFTETAKLHLVKKKGAILKEEGTATGTLPGTVKARFDTSDITHVTASVTFYPYSGGSLTFNATGHPDSTGTVASFSGFMAVRKGTGRYENALGSGSFTGTVNRKTWAFTVNAKATLTY